MITRGQKRKRSLNEQESVGHDAPTSAGEPPATSNPKRQRRTRGRRGSLEDLPNMPLDIVFEILVYLEPLDLLNLSRTSKDLRGLLMSKSSEAYWKVARRNMDGLPDCPSFLSEPAFVNLLFSNYCHKCLKPNAKTPQWTLRIRLCNTCFLSDSEASWNCHLDFPTGWIKGAPSRAPLWLLPKHDFAPVAGRRGRGERILYSDISAFEQKMRDAVASGVTYQQFEATETVVARQITEFGWACGNWHKKRKSARASELKDLKVTRLQAVIQRLRDCGWNMELDHIARMGYKELTTHKAVREGKPLTERAWNKLRGPLEESMKTVREKLQKLAKTKLFKSRFKVAEDVLHSWRREYDTLFPHVRQFVDIPEVRAILESPDSVSLTTEHFDVLKPTLLELISQWREDAQQRFFNQLIDNKRCYEGIGDDEALSLARTWLFYCRRCDCHRSYPEVLTHYCRSYATDYEDGDYSSTADLVFLTRHPHPGSIFGLTDVIAKAIRLCGLDPNKATRSDMDALTARFCSITYMRTNGYVTAMSWHGVAQSYTINRRTDEFKLLSEGDAARACALEDAASNDGTHLRPKLCAHCPQLASSSHFATVHNIADPIESDYFRHPDTPPRAVPIVYFAMTNTPTEKLPYRFHEAMKAGLAEYRDIQIDEKAPIS